MINYYLKQAFRNLQKARLITVGSIFTISLGTLSIALLFSYVNNELSMDKFHRRHKDIYMMVIQGTTQQNKWDIVQASYLYNFNYKEYPELERLTTIKKYARNEIKFTSNGLSYFPEGIATDSSLLKIFDFKLLTGSFDKALSEPKTVLLTEGFAKKMFGNEDPLGKTITLKAGFEDIYTVNGIVENPPSNSSFQFDFIFRHRTGDGADLLLVKPGFNKNEFIKKIEKIPQLAQDFKFSNAKLGLIPFDDIYFSEGIGNFGYNNIFSHSGDKNTLKVLALVMLIILAISALNLSNLQVVNINSSIKNIGVNKIAGASGLNLFYLKLTEIILLTTLSVFLICMAYIAILPWFNTLINGTLNPNILRIAVLNTVIIAVMVLLAMIYPAVLVSKLPIKLSLKNQIFSENKLVGRQVIIVVQFALSIALLITSSVVIKQLNMMLEKDLGFHTSNIIKTQLVKPEPFPSNPTEQSVKEYSKRRGRQEEKFYVAMNELRSCPYIEAVSQLRSPIEAFSVSWGIDNGTGEFNNQYTLEVTPNHLSLFDFKLVTGRFFDETADKEREKKVVINEAAMKYWKIKNISQTRIKNGYQDSPDGYEILGVVKDFNFRHLSVKPQPLIMLYKNDITSNVFIRFKDGAIKSGLQFVQKLYSQITPGEPFNYRFLSDEISAMYDKEKRLSQIYILFTLTAFFISLSGLFTIALYDTTQKTKEIGIRKVNGATISEVMTMLNKDFVKWVAIAFVIATPIAWFAMSKWLENFAYKTEISWWIFALAGLHALGIALLTVSWQSWKAATRNPVEALRYE